MANFSHVRFVLPLHKVPSLESNLYHLCSSPLIITLFLTQAPRSSTHRFQNLVKYLRGPRANSFRMISRVKAARKNHSASFTLNAIQNAFTSMSRSNDHWKYLGCRRGRGAEGLDYCSE